MTMIIEPREPEDAKTVCLWLGKEIRETIDDLAAKTGLTKSHIMRTYIVEGLKSDGYLKTV